MLGPIESAALALAITIPWLLMFKRSMATYAPGAAPSWWQVWH